MPESIRICGDCTAPAQSRISRFAHNSCVALLEAPGGRISTVVAMPFSKLIFCTGESVSSVRFGRDSAGRRKAFAVESRRPLRMVPWRNP